MLFKNTSKSLLKRNKIFYDYFVNKKIIEAKDKLTKEELLERIIFIIKYSWRNHAGYYSDGRIENILLDFGQNLDQYFDKSELQNDLFGTLTRQEDFTLLHIATELGDSGGHTRMLYQLLKRYNYGKQILVLTDQAKDDIPVWFIDGIGSNITVITLKTINSLFRRAYILRYISKYCKKILLHHHPYDAVPIIAFSYDNCPPVLIDNHAHSWFWLGPSIADLVYTYSEFHKNFTLKTRPIDNVYLLHSIDTDDVDSTFDWKEKSNSKKKLGIDPNAICIITVGTQEKFVPNANYNFFQTAEKIVRRFKNVEIFIIGIDNASHLNEKHVLNSRKIHFVGTVIDLGDYYKAADIYLEALPQPSIGVTVMSTPIGLCCPLLKYGSGKFFNALSSSSLYEKYVGPLKTEEEYLDKLEFIINRPDIRRMIAEEIRAKFVIDYSKQSICRSIKEMLELTDVMKHRIKKIPDGTFYYDKDSVEIAGDSELQNVDGVIGLFRKYFNWKDIISIIAKLSIQCINSVDIIRYIYARFAFKTNYLVRQVKNNCGFQ